MIRLISGYHMTATRRRAFAALIAQGIEAGKVGRTTYRVIREEDGTYTGTATAAQSSWEGTHPVTDRYRFTA